MTRSELIQRLLKRFPEVSEEYVERIVTLIFDEITMTLAKKKRAEFRSFGAFSIRHRQGRLGRNPRTGDVVRVKDKDLPFFKCGRSLLAHLNHWKKSA